METTTHSALSAEGLLAENQQLRERLAQLEQELHVLKRLLFGTRSERFVPTATEDQLPLFEALKTTPLAEPVASKVVSTPRRPRKKPVRQVLPSHLRREVIVIEPEGDTSTMRKIGEEVTETLDYRPAKLVVVRRVRPKYVDPLAEGVIIAPLPARAVEKGMAEPGLLAHVVIEKYVDHLPLYRQVQRFGREGITLAASTLGDWTKQVADLLRPLYEALKTKALSGSYLQADETPIPVQDAEKEGSTHRGYYWVYHAPLSALVVMDYQAGRGRDGPNALLKGYQGALQSDGYVVYDGYDQRDGITRYGCWAHARRYFHDALGSSPSLGADALKQIGKLYGLEQMLRETDASVDERRRVRQEHAVPLLRGFKAWLGEHPGLPQSPWGKAVHYSLHRWDKLTRYTEDGRIEIDNNLVENTIRPIALGRKNYLFAGSHEAAERAAVLYSLLATCKKHGVNPEVWLRDVLTRLPEHPYKRIEELLPHHWKQMATAASKNEGDC